MKVVMVMCFEPNLNKCIEFVKVKNFTPEGATNGKKCHKSLN
jgi:hypothetical protein